MKNVSKIDPISLQNGAQEGSRRPPGAVLGRPGGIFVSRGRLETLVVASQRHPGAVLVAKMGRSWVALGRRNGGKREAKMHEFLKASWDLLGGLWKTFLVKKETNMKTNRKTYRNASRRSSRKAIRKKKRNANRNTHTETNGQTTRNNQEDKREDTQENRHEDKQKDKQETNQEFRQEDEQDNKQEAKKKKNKDEDKQDDE